MAARERERDRGRARFHDRDDAGRQLAEALADRRAEIGADPVVLALPRGGITVAAPVARRLGAPLAALPVRKVGAPGRPELALGAIAAVGDRVERYRNEALIRHVGVSQADFDAAREREETELARRVARYGRPPELTGRAVVLIDDGLATGATMLAAARVLAATEVTSLIVAVPVGPRSAVRALAAYAKVVCLRTPEPFVAVGQAYEDFDQVADAEVDRLLGLSGP